MFTWNTFLVVRLVGGKVRRIKMEERKWEFSTYLVWWERGGWKKDNEWMFTGFYGEPNTQKRHEAWAKLRTSKNRSVSPWLCVGDYNEITWRFVRDRAPSLFSFGMLGQTHVNGWSCVIASQNGGSTSYIFLFRLRVLQWSCHLFNYWKNKKIINEKFLIWLIWNWIYINLKKITWLCFLVTI